MTFIEKELREIEETTKQLPTRPIQSCNIRTPEEIEHEEHIHQEALKLGINLDMTNDAAEAEDSDKLQALIYLMKGKQVPEELRTRILDKKNTEEYKGYMDEK